MTLIEFLAPIRDSKYEDIVLAVLYYKKETCGQASMTVTEIREALRGIRLKKVARANISDVLGRSEHYVDCPASIKGKRVWKLTGSGGDHILEVLGIEKVTPEIKHNVETLKQALIKIPDQDIKDFVGESISCFQAGFLRASVVLLWSGAVLSLRRLALNQGNKKLNFSIKRFDTKSRFVTKIDDFSYLKDATLLLVLQDLGLIDKSQREALEGNLKLRNSCGHPAKYRPGKSKVAGFIEDITSIVFNN